MAEPFISFEDHC